MLGSNSNADSGPKNQADYPSCYPVWFFRERIPLRDWHKAINSAGLFLPASEASGWMPESGGQGLSEAKALVCGFRQRLFCRKPERMDQPLRRLPSATRSLIVSPPKRVSDSYENFHFTSRFEFSNSPSWQFTAPLESAFYRAG